MNDCSNLYVELFLAWCCDAKREKCEERGAERERKERKEEESV